MEPTCPRHGRGPLIDQLAGPFSQKSPSSKELTNRSARWQVHARRPDSSLLPPPIEALTCMAWRLPTHRGAISVSTHMTHEVRRGRPH